MPATPSSCPASTGSPVWPLQDLITLVAQLRPRGIGFRSKHENLDTTTPGGRLAFYVFAALAEFIRELIVDGTREGLAAGRARGVRLGRPPAMTAEQVRHARDLLARPDNTVSSIARLLGVSRSTIYKHVPELGRHAGGTARALDAILAELPEDTRARPDVTQYDDLLPSRRPSSAAGDAVLTNAYPTPAVLAGSTPPPSPPTPADRA